MRYICTSIVATCMLAGSTFAATINVPGDYATIQGAIDASSDGDEIIVAPGTYTSSGNEVVNTFGKAITIKASGTPEETIIDGENERRVILCNAGETAGTAIEGFTITRGSVTSGSGGSNRSGAGIFCGNSSPTITGCTISNNAAGWSAGGICCNESSPTITDCTITGNTAAESDGGGINCSYSSHPMITGCTITNNTANGSWGGGGITCYESSTPTFSNCTISDNTAPSGGGITCYNSGNPTITDCTISNNTAAEKGGGIAYFAGSGGSMIGCEISGNTATAGYPSSYGGGVHIAESSPLISSCVISDNSDTHAAGGLAAINSESIIENCLFTNNFGAQGAAWVHYGSPTFIDCSIVNNNGTSIGGVGMDASTPTFNGCVVVGNVGPACGGIHDISATSTASLLNTTICSNTGGQVCDNYTDLGGNTIEEVCTDTDGDGIPEGLDNCDLYNPDQADCNDNGVGDVCDIANFTSFDCDQNGVPDECQPDCDGDGWIDPCDSEGDIDGDGIPDNCEDDCNDNGIPDDTELKNGWATDCNGNGILDECDIASDPSLDCDGNGALDSCEIEDDQSLDCNGNGTLDECDLGGQIPAEGAVQWTVAEGGNGHWYQLILDPGIAWSEANNEAIAMGGHLVTLTSEEENDFVVGVVDNSGTWSPWIGLYQDLDDPDYSEPAGGWKWVTGESYDYTKWAPSEPGDDGGIGADHANIWLTGAGAGRPLGFWNDWIDGSPNGYIIEFAAGDSHDCNINGIPDECDIADGTSNDANGNGIPDECEDDCNTNGVPDHWDIKTGTSEDCNTNGIPDECDTANGTSNDVNSNSIPDECEADCNGNGSPDDWDLVTGWSEDCNGNLIPDECDIAGEAPEGAVRWTVEEGGNGHWYQNISGTNPPDGDVGITWNDGRTDALAIGGDLASLETDEEMNWVFNQIASDPASWWYNAGENDGPYLGGFQDTTAPDYNEPGGGWYWLTGTPLQSTFWGPAQPNDSSGSQNHLHFWSPGTEIDMTFDDVGETDTGGGNAYIIEWDAGFFPFSLDCNTNGIPDECDIADETSEDINGDGVPDECQCLADIDGSGAVAIDDILAVSGYWGSSNPVADLNGDGIVAIQDLLIVISEWGPCP